MTIQDIVERAAFADVYSDCERFLDAPDDIEGQPFVVWNEDIYQHLAELPTIAGVLLDEIAGIKFSEAPDSITHDEKDASPDLRGSLPSSASPSARRFEKLAHRAATIIRSDGVSAQKAFATLAQHETSNFTDIDITSLPNAIRRSFQIMYDKRGLPLKN